MKQRGLKISPYLSFALLSLCLSVFAWGVQAKLSLYRMVPDQATPIVAKLSTESHAIETREAISQIPADVPPWEKVVLMILAAAVPLAWLGPSDRLLDPFLSARDRLRFEVVHALHRPPPSFV